MVAGHVLLVEGLDVISLSAAQAKRPGLLRWELLVVPGLGPLRAVGDQLLFPGRFTGTQIKLGLVVTGDGKNVIAGPGRVNEAPDARIVAFSDVSRCLELGKRRHLVRFSVGPVTPELGSCSRVDQEGEDAEGKGCFHI